MPLPCPPDTTPSALRTRRRTASHPGLQRLSRAPPARFLLSAERVFGPARPTADPCTHIRPPGRSTQSRPGRICRPWTQPAPARGARTDEYCLVPWVKVILRARCERFQEAIVSSDGLFFRLSVVGWSSAGSAQARGSVVVAPTEIRVGPGVGPVQS